MFLAVLFPTAKNWKHLQCLSREWTNVVNQGNTSLNKRNKLLIRATLDESQKHTWVSRSLAQKSKNCMTLFIWNSRNRKTNPRWLLWGGGGDWLGMNMRKRPGFDRNVLYLDGVGYTSVCICQKSRESTLKIVHFNV